MHYRYQLDSSSKKFECPSCGKRRLVRYVDLENNAYLPEHIGRCDREIKCAYHCTPKSIKSYGHYEPILAPVQEPTIPFEDFEASWVEAELVQSTLQYYKQNNFVQFLYNKLGKKNSEVLIKRYEIGTSKYWKGATIFWQKDIKGNVRTGKVMLYNPKDGHRIKEPFSHIHWVHSLMLKQGLVDYFFLKQCLFGEHLLVENGNRKAIAIVESEKTAILMSHYYPNYEWLACGSLSNINKQLFEPLREYSIRLYPDLGALEKWKEKAYWLVKQGFRIEVSELLEQEASLAEQEQGLDLADFLLSKTAIFQKKLKNELSDYKG